MTAPAQDLRSFVDAYARAFPGEVVRVQEPVSTEHDVMALVLEYERRRRWPIVLFEHVQGHDIPIVANVVASRRALAAHMERAEGRGAGWIERALALKQRAERDNFEYRTAAGALAALYYGHRETQEKVRAALPQAPLLDEQARARLQQAAKDAESAAEQELESLRRLPLG